jgi:hypothetical protein
MLRYVYFGTNNLGESTRTEERASSDSGLANRLIKDPRRRSRSLFRQIVRPPVPTRYSFQ